MKLKLISRNYRILLSILVLLLLHSAAFAAIPIAFFPWEGNYRQKYKAEAKFREFLIRDGSIAIIDKQNRDKVLEIHKRAQSMGSSYHDISKLNVAQFLLDGKIQEQTLILSLVDVNQGTEILSQSVQLSPHDFAPLMSVAAKVKKLILSRGQMTSKVPEEVKSMMDHIQGFQKSLSGDMSQSFPYLAFYSNNRFVHPASSDKMLVEKSEYLIRGVRKKLIRADLNYVRHESQGETIMLTVMAAKYGKKSQHTFYIAELEDGSLGIIDIR